VTLVLVHAGTISPLHALEVAGIVVLFGVAFQTHHYCRRPYQSELDHCSLLRRQPGMQLRAVWCQLEAD